MYATLNAYFIDIEKNGVLSAALWIYTEEEK